LKQFSENQFGLDHFAPEAAVVDAGAKPLAGQSPGQLVEGASGGASIDRRQHPRYVVDGDAEVLLADGSQIFRGRILDISLSGCFIATQARLRAAVGTPVDMVFRANGVMLRTAATVRAVRPGKGAGFLFDGLSERMRVELQSLIEALDLAKPDVPCLVIPPGRRSG
jgi:hypothetical protein